MPPLLHYIVAKGSSRRTGSPFKWDQQGQQAIWCGFKKAKHHKVSIQITFAIDREPELFAQILCNLIAPTFIKVMVTNIGGISDTERVTGLKVLEGTNCMESRILGKYCCYGPRSVNLYTIISAKTAIGSKLGVARSEVQDTRYSCAIFMSNFPHQSDNLKRCLNL
jgi:hypothetical protein